MLLCIAQEYLHLTLVLSLFLVGRVGCCPPSQADARQRQMKQFGLGFSIHWLRHRTLIKRKKKSQCYFQCKYAMLSTLHTSRKRPGLWLELKYLVDFSLRGIKKEMP